MDPLLFVATVLTAGLTAAGTFYGLRQRSRLGISEAQMTLNEIRDDTIGALKAQGDVLLRKVEHLEDDAAVCKARLAEVERENRALTVTIKEMVLRSRETP